MLYITIYYLQGGSAHALIFSWACWSGIWPRLNARRLAVPNWDCVIVEYHIRACKSRILVGKNPRRACQSVATGLWSCFIIKRHKKSFFGGEKKPGGNAKASPLAWGGGYIPCKQPPDGSI